jgi:hypothetical protein
MVTAGHVVLLTGLLLSSSFSGCLHRSDPIIPMLFTVEVPMDRTAVTPQKKDDPTPVAIKDPVKETSKKDSAVVTKAPAIQVSSNRVVRVSGGTRPKKSFSAAELKRIEELLAAGATPSDRTLIPGEEDMCLIRIKDTLYKAWQKRPSLDEVGRATAEVTIRFAPDGAIISRRFSGKSGKASLDDSVWEAAGVVTRVDGLTEAFLRQHGHEIIVAFRLEEDTTGGL